MVSSVKNSKMLQELVAGYGSESDSEGSASDGDGKKKEKVESGASATKSGNLQSEQPPLPKRKLPSASAMIAATSSWARPDQGVEQKEVDKVGTKYNNVPPPTGVRAEDGIAGADYIKPKVGSSLDSSKLYTGDRVLAKSPGSQTSTNSAPAKPALLVPPQLRGNRKNVSTEDLGYVFALL
jgi:hypothetical protein